MNSTSIKVWYTNYRGETALREIRPINVWYGKTEHHPEDQFILSAYDYGKEAVRDFALKDCDFARAYE